MVLVWDMALLSPPRAMLFTPTNGDETGSVFDSNVTESNCDPRHSGYHQKYILYTMVEVSAPYLLPLQDYMFSDRRVYIYIYFSVTDLPLQAGNKPAASGKEIKTCPESEGSWSRRISTSPWRPSPPLGLIWWPRLLSAAGVTYGWSLLIYSASMSQTFGLDIYTGGLSFAAPSDWGKYTGISGGDVRIRAAAQSISHAIYRGNEHFCIMLPLRLNAVPLVGQLTDFRNVRSGLAALRFFFTERRRRSEKEEDKERSDTTGTFAWSRRSLL
jgi:hypothetical protein